jgi:predicted flap endonuclease-1-like 5' DNA nuclease
MFALIVQTLLLMGAAYFVGAACACLIRRALFVRAPAKPVERRVDPLPSVAQHGFGSPRLKPAPAGDAPPAPAPSPASEPAVASQDLKQISSIDAALEVRLNQLGISRYEQIAGWMQADVQRIGQALGMKGRINQENWIEQAQILARGGETHYAARRARGEVASASPTPDEGEPRIVQSSATLAQVSISPRPATGRAAGVVAEIAVAPPDVSTRAAFAAPASGSAMTGSAPSIAAQRGVPEAAVSIRPVPPPARDKLQRISGIDAQIEEQLIAEGVTRYHQIAQWSSADVARFDQDFGPGRIARENWVEQAQILSRGGDTAYSRKFDGQAIEPAPPRPLKLEDAIREHAATAAEDARRSTLGDLGSVRSLRGQHDPEPGPEAAHRAAAQNRVIRPAEPNDLKRIRGIGVLIEKKLKSMGVVSYEQIANWTAEDIDRVSQTLDFKGRIERENWIEQARILASGGATEFSRRVDRGEVETSRSRS